jgi:hypothetical protein
LLGLFVWIWVGVAAITFIDQSDTPLSWVERLTAGPLAVTALVGWPVTGWILKREARARKVAEKLTS